MLLLFCRSIDAAPVKCNCLLLENTSDRLWLFTKRIKEFYKRQMTLQVHKMLGSLDVLGTAPLCNVVVVVGTGGRAGGPGCLVREGCMLGIS